MYLVHKAFLRSAWWVWISLYSYIYRIQITPIVESWFIYTRMNERILQKYRIAENFPRHMAYHPLLCTLTGNAALYNFFLFSFSLLNSGEVFFFEDLENRWIHGQELFKYSWAVTIWTKEKGGVCDSSVETNDTIMLRDFCLYLRRVVARGSSQSQATEERGKRKGAVAMCKEGWGSMFGTTKWRTTGISKFRNYEY